MGETAFLFPGQGSQAVGMFDPFCEAWDAARATFDRLADEDLSRLVFEADAAELRKTTNAQQTVFATSLAASNGVQDRTELTPDIVAGHSLGHITAATEAGIIDPEDGLDLVRRRGELMARAEREAGPGTMCAVMFVPPESVTEATADRPNVTVGGFNSPQQTVLSGPADAVGETAAEIEDSVGGRLIELDVHSGFHSPVMEPAVEPFADTLDGFSFSEASVPVISDCEGTTYESGERGRELLAEQLTEPVDWVSVVETLEAEGVERAVVLPPAEDIARLTRRNTDAIEIISLDAPETVQERNQ